MDECGNNFFQVYPYVNPDLWKSLNELYTLICDLRVDETRTLFLESSKQLVEILAEPLQTSH